MILCIDGHEYAKGRNASGNLEIRIAESGRYDSNLCNFHRWCHHRLDIFLPRLVDQAEGLQGLSNSSQDALPP